MIELTLESQRELINGKHVAVVGNATSLFDHRYGEFIDESQVVIRLNRGLISAHLDIHRSLNSLGDETDVLAGFHFDEDAWRLEGKPPVWYYDPRQARGEHRKWEGMAEWHAHDDDTDERLSSGSRVLETLCFKMEPASVTLYGFDFFETGTWYGADTKPHDSKVEEDFILKELGYRRVATGTYQWIGQGTHKQREAELLRYMALYDHTELPYQMGGRLRRVVPELFRDLPVGTDLLDVGCGRGETRDLTPEGVTWRGVEIVPKLIHDDVDGMFGIHAIPFSDGAFNTVACFDVLEHILPVDTYQGLSELLRVAKDRLFLTIAWGEDACGPMFDGKPLHINCHKLGWWLKKIAACTDRSHEIAFEVIQEWCRITVTFQ